MRPFATPGELSTMKLQTFEGAHHTPEAPQAPGKFHCSSKRLRQPTVLPNRLRSPRLQAGAQPCRAGGTRTALSASSAWSSRARLTFSFPHVKGAATIRHRVCPHQVSGMSGPLAVSHKLCWRCRLAQRAGSHSTPFHPLPFGNCASPLCGGLRLQTGLSGPSA